MFCKIPHRDLNPSTGPDFVWTIVEHSEVLNVKRNWIKKMNEFFIFRGTKQTQ